MKLRWEQQLEAYKHSASLANSEWGAIEGELLQERKGFLDSMVKHRELRTAHEVPIYTHMNKQKALSDALSLLHFLVM